MVKLQETLGNFVSGQLRRPTGAFGRLVMTRMLNRGNTPLTDETLARLELRRSNTVLDVGFGGGRALRQAARRVTDGHLWGLDFSPDVVAAGQRSLADLIAAGRLELLRGDVGDMPLRDALFDRIVTLNTIYFWPDPARAAGELLRVLKPGGLLAIGYSGAAKMREYPLLTDTFRFWEAEEVEALLQEAGFIEIRSDALRGKVTRGDFVTVARR